MANSGEMLAAGIANHRAGRLGEAEQIYRQILASDPTLPQAWYLLGLIANQVGKHEVAVELLDHALSLAPDFADAICEQGTALVRLGKTAEAIERYQRAIGLKPDYAEAHYNLGNALLIARQGEEAVRHFQRALELKPEMADAYNALGLVLVEGRMFAEAEKCFRRATELEPTMAGFQHNLGIVLLNQGLVDEAIRTFRQAIELDPNNAESHYNLGEALRQKHELDAAIVAYRRALELKPQFVGACTDLGVTLHDQEKFEEAEACQLQALAWNPDSFEAHNNIGMLYQDLSRLDEALGHYSRALELQPDIAGARHNYSTLLLLRGDFEQGWPEYEWRWKTKHLKEPKFSEPRWDGSPLGARTILLYAEQGFGDTIQFIRYAAVVKKQNPMATVAVQCQRQLTRLLARCPGIDHLVGEGSELPPFDVHLPLLSVPMVLRTSLETIPGDVPYLFAEAELVAHWREWLSPYQGLRIGINWQGRAEPGAHLRRNIPLSFFAAMAAQLPGIKLVGLQKGPATAELARSGLPIVDPGPDFDTTNGPFMDTAAIIKNLDLVVTSDTAIPHLAGALGVPVWLALPFVPNWRWLLDRDDSPWYPTMRLFRQPALGDWPGVFRQIQLALNELINAQNRRN